MNAARVVSGYDDQPAPLQQRQDVMRVIAFQEQIIPVEQVLFEVREFRVFELKSPVELSGRRLKHLAVTTDHQLYSIDVLAGLRKLLSECFGQARVMWC